MRRAIRRVRHVWRLSAGLALLAMASGCSTPVTNTVFPTAERPCPAWVEFPTDRHSNEETAYLGCSVDANLKTTLEDRRDLERGRDLGPASGARESLAVGQYEAGQSKPLPSNGSPTPTIVLSGGNGAAQ